jgi:hypothetical protein
MMKKDFQEKLYKDFPQLFKKLSCSCEEGWFNLIYKTCQKIMKIGVDKDFKFTQIKEKFGDLRIYYNNYSNPEINAIIHNAESESHYICEWCGSRENVTQDGDWTKTLCQRCHEMRREGWRPWIEREE